MFATGLVCSNCEANFPIGPSFFGCPNCERGGVRGALEVDYDYAGARDNFAQAMSRESGPDRMWRFRALLPIRDAANVVTLGEGGTPLLQLPPGGPNPLTGLFVKNESSNPTWAFKDRFHSVSLSMARELGYEKAVASTTGNHGLSLAAYARAAGMAVTIFADPRAPRVQRRAMQLFGARVIVRSQRREALAEFVRRDWYPSTYMTPMPVSTPYGMEGYKTLAYETVADLGDAPDHFLVPTAAGDGFYGPWKGFRELKNFGLSTHEPRMHAVQALGANWLAETIRQNADHALFDDDADSLAVSIADPIGGYMCVRAVKESGGSVAEVGEDEIVEATRFLASRGLLAEPASAASIAAAWALFRDGRIERDSLCVCVLTGAGIKWPDAIELVSGPDRELVEPPLEEILAMATGASPQVSAPGYE